MLTKIRNFRKVQHHSDQIRRILSAGIVIVVGQRQWNSNSSGDSSANNEWVKEHAKGAFGVRAATAGPIAVFDFTARIVALTTNDLSFGNQHLLPGLWWSRAPCPDSQVHRLLRRHEMVETAAEWPHSESPPIVGLGGGDQVGITEYLDVRAAEDHAWCGNDCSPQLIVSVQGHVRGSDRRDRTLRGRDDARFRMCLARHAGAGNEKVQR